MNVTELRTELSNIFDDLRAGRIDAKTASELSNVAGKMISSAKTELAYHVLRDTPCPEIAFLENTPKLVSIIEGESTNDNTL